MKRGRMLLALWITLGSLAGHHARAARVVLQQGLHGYAGTADTWLDEFARRANYGASTSLVVRYDALDGGFIEDSTLVKFVLPNVSYDTLSNGTLEIFYFSAGDMLNNNALGVKPYRISPTKNWYENNRNGESGEGANWRYSGQAETSNNEWTAQSGGWYDKIDDGNPSNRLKKTGGTAPGAIEPTNWVPFDITGSVRQWLGGTTNNGIILFSCSFEGSGSDAYVQFASRETETPAFRPRLRLHYTGAQIVWTGLYGNAWDTTSTNWSVGGYPGCYDDGDHVLFNDYAAQTNVVLTAERCPASATFSNSPAKAFAVSGAAIAGTGNVFKIGQGYVTLASSNRYAGLTRISAGTLAISTNGALGSVEAGTVVESSGTLTLRSCPYSAPEPLMLGGTLAASEGTNLWAGPVDFISVEGSPAAIVAHDVLSLMGPFSGTGDVRVSGGTVLLTGAATSSWSGAISVNSGTLQLDRMNGPVFGGGLTVGETDSATVLVSRAGQWTPGQRLHIKESSLLSFAATGATYCLDALCLQGGAVDSGPTLVYLARTVTALTANSPAVLQGLFELAHTGVVFQVDSGMADPDLIVAGALTHGGIWKAGFGTMVLAGANAVTDTIAVSQGHLVLAHTQALGTAPLWVNSHSTVYLSTNGTWTNDLILLGGLLASDGATATWAGPITMGAGMYTFGALPGAVLILDTALDATNARLHFLGGGEVKLLRDALYSQGTEITNVTVLVCNRSGSALGTGLITLYAGGTLKGTGIVHAPVAVGAAATLAPGFTAGEGTLTISNHVNLLSNSVFVVGQSLSSQSALDLSNGGGLNIDTDAVLVVNGILQGTRPIVFVRGATSLKGHFAGLPSGASLPSPNSHWFIHYQPNGIYVSTNSRPVVYFRSLDNDGIALVSWRTPVEMDVIGFDLYREEGGMWHKVNADPVPALYPNGGAYFFADLGAPPGATAHYQLVQLLANGQSNVLITCERDLSAMEFTGAFEPSETKTVLRWRSREDEDYWLEWMPHPDADVQTNWGPMPATPSENSYQIPLLGSQGLLRVRWIP
jgi:autotransporter-associated beta strand protein